MNIFVASSAGAKAQANAFIKGCNRADITFLPWWEEFLPGKTLTEELRRICRQVDGALVILSPESDTKLRGRKQPIPNLNVLFEYGFFYGALGPDSVAVVHYGEFHLPSDLGGVIHITGGKHFTRCRAVRVGKRTKTEFERWLKRAKVSGPEPKEQIRALKGEVRPKGANPILMKYYEGMKERIGPLLKPRIELQNPYRFAWLKLENGCQVRYDILSREENIVRIAFKSWTSSPEVVKRKVAQMYPNWDQMVEGHTLTILPGKGNVISYFTDIRLSATADLMSNLIVNEASRVFKILLDKFSIVAAGLD